MATTENTYTGNGATTNYSFTFPYLETADIKVSVDGNDTSAYTLANATTVSFNVAPENGAAIRIYRQTDDGSLAATFYPGSSIRSQDLNDNFTKSLYIAQEAKALASTAATGDIPDGGITSSLLATDAVSTVKIADGAVTTPKLADNAVSTAKIAGGAVTEAKLSFTPLKSTDLGVSVQAYDTDTAKTDVAQSFTKAQRGTVVTLTDQATVAVDMALGNNFELTLGGNRTLGAPTNVVAGQSGVIRVVQDGTGSRTLAYNSAWKFPGGTAPTLTTTASAVDLLCYYVETSGRVAVRFIGDVK